MISLLINNGSTLKYTLPPAADTPYDELDSITSLKGRIELNKKGAYIDTGVPINQNSIRIETAFRAESIDGTNIFGDTDILGCATRPTYNGLRLYYEWSKTKTTLNIQSGSSLHNSKSYFELLTNPSASKNTIIIEATNGQPLSVTLNGNKITSNGNVNLNYDGTILLMASCVEDSVYTGKLTLYPTKIYVDNVLVRDYIPVKLKISNKVGLMDLVENKFYDSVNGEPFTYYSENYPKFNNPLVSGRNMADPTVWDGEDGYYYAWYTGTIKENVIVPLYKSKDLITWTNTNTFPLEKSERIKIEELGNSLSTYSCWAPEIVKINDRQWNLYLSLGKYYMMVFKSNNPTRNFTFDKILIANNTKVGSNQIGLSGNIDPCVRKDEDGRLWMFWGSMSGIWRVELTSDGLNLVSNAIKTHVAGGWTSIGIRDNIFEGPYLYKRNNWWYLFVSSGLYNKNYKLRVGRSATLTGDFKDVNGISLTEAQNATTDNNGILTVNGVTNFAPILLEGKYSQQQFYDPGHNGTIIEDINGKTFMFFHARVTSEGNSGVNRRLCISEVFWDNDGWPYFAFENDSGHGIVTTSSYGPKLN